MEPPTQDEAAPSLFSNALAAASLVAGALGILAIGVDLVIGFLFGLIACTLGVFGLRRSRQGAGGRGIAIGGIAVGGVSLFLLAIALLLVSIHFPAM